MGPNIMKKNIISVILISWMQISLGAEALLTGQGQVISSPDYVELNITIDSKCYPSPLDARKINDDAARKIVDFLNTKIKKKDLYNSVVSAGGYTLPYQTYYQDKYLCLNTFQKQNNITFRTQDLAHFETLFDEIQNTVYKQLQPNPPSVIESSISYVTMAAPVPGISTKLRAELEQKAMGLAYTDATEKLSALFGKKVQNVKVIYASELPPDEPKPLFRQEVAPMALMGARMEKSSAAPVQFEEQTINKIIYFKFNFDDVPISPTSE